MAADKEQEEMMNTGITETSSSLWTSVVVMVPKKNNQQMRCCVDYRLLNKVTRTPITLPIINEYLG